MCPTVGHVTRVMVLQCRGFARVGYQAARKGWGKDILANCGGSVTWQNLWENNLAIMKRLYNLIP